MYLHAWTTVTQLDRKATSMLYSWVEYGIQPQSSEV